jgi:hypothetical protein
MAVPNLPGSERVPGHTGDWGMDVPIGLIDAAFWYIDGWVMARRPSPAGFQEPVFTAAASSGTKRAAFIVPTPVTRS